MANNNNNRDAQQHINAYNAILFYIFSFFATHKNRWGCSVGVLRRQRPLQMKNKIIHATQLDQLAAAAVARIFCLV